MSRATNDERRMTNGVGGGSEGSELPKGWTIQTFQDIFGRLQYGYTAKATPHTQGIRFLRITDIDKGIIDWDQVPSCEDIEEDLSRYRLKDGDFVFARSGSIEKAARIQNPPDSVFASYLIRGIPKDPSNSDWMAWFIQSPLYLEQVRAAAAGIGLSNVNAQKLAAVRVPLPPLDEQRRIVAKLDALFARSQRARAELERVPQLVERTKQAILAAAFSGELTIDWRTSTSNIILPNRSQIDHERRTLFFAEEASKSRYQTPEATPFATPFDLPDTWSWFRAEAICDLITKGTTPPASAMTASAGEIPYIKVYNLTFDASLDFEKDPTFISVATHERELQRSKVFPGDVLMNIVGPPLGKVSLVPDLWPEWNINQAIAIFRPITALRRQFLAYWLLSEQVLTWAVSLSKATAGQHNLTLQICRDLPIPLCSLNEQAEIVRRIEAAFARIDRMAAEAARATALLDRLEQATLAKAFRGELLSAERTEQVAEEVV